MLHLGYPTSVTTYLAYNVVAVRPKAAEPATSASSTTTASRRRDMVHFTFPARQFGKKSTRP